MSRFVRFLKLYWTELITDGFGKVKVIADPVRIEFFRGPRTYNVFVPVTPPVVRAGVERDVATLQSMKIPEERTYIELIARTDESLGRRQYCEEKIDRVVTQLSALLSPNLFAQEVWSGWLSDSERAVGDLWLTPAPSVDLEPVDLQNRLDAFQRAVARNGQIDSRFTLMSKLFARAIAIAPGEERFLWLWTVLEIFPMQNRTNILPISEYLSKTIGRTPAEVKEKLGIGRLFGARSSLVHDGKLPYTRGELGSILKKLELIDLTVLTSLGGLPYEGQLDQFFL